VASAMSEMGNKGIEGDGNINTGSIHIEDKRSQIFNIEQKELAEAERYRQNTSQYYNTCVELIKDGFIDNEGIKLLKALRHELGLHKDIAEHIEKEVIEESTEKRAALSGAVIDFISRVKGYIKINNKSQIQASFVQLEAYQKKIDDVHLEQLYFQLKAILYPSYYLKDYSAGTTSYWEAFWSYVALVRMDNGEAAQSLANLVRWDNYFPYQNQSILQTIGLLMQDKVQEAREAYKSIIIGFSSDLEPVCDAIRELLDQDWDLVTDVSPQTKFYVESLFRRAYDQIKDQAGKRKAAEIAAIHQQELEAQAIQDKKENFILQYEAKKGSIRDALILSGVTQTQYEEWKRYDANFRLSLENVDKRLAQEKIDAERRIEELKEAFLVHYESDNGSISAAMAHSGIEQSHFDEWKGTDSRFRTRLNDIDALLAAKKEEENQKIQRQKEHLLSCYEAYECDLQKACKEVGSSPEIVKEWQNTDLSFNNSINYIKRKYDAKRRKKILAVVLPCILIAILCVIIGFQLKNAANARLLADAANDRYEEATTNLSAIIEAIPNNVDDISIEKHFNALVAGCDSLKAIVALEQKPQLKGNEVSSRLRHDLLNKAKIILNKALKLHGTSSDVPNYASEQELGEEYVNKVDALIKQLNSK
jgi:hypothetical protein